MGAVYLALDNYFNEETLKCDGEVCSQEKSEKEVINDIKSLINLFIGDKLNISMKKEDAHREARGFFSDLRSGQFEYGVRFKNINWGSII